MAEPSVTTVVTGKVERKYMGHFVNTKFNSTATAEYVRLGSDLEEFTVDLSPNTETSTNILGETTFKHNGYEATSDADSYYANTNDALFPVMQDIIDNRSTGDQCKTDVVEVHLWEQVEENTYIAWKQPCYIIPTSYGGDTSGYQIPFQVNYFGARTKGKFNVTTKTFTAI